MSHVSRLLQGCDRALRGGGPGRVCAGAGAGDPGQVLQRQQAPGQGDHRRPHEAQGPHQGDEATR